MDTTDQEAEGNVSPTLDMSPIAAIWGKIREKEPWTDVEREQVLDELFPGDHRLIPYLKRFFSLLILSTMIAAFGLIANSAAVVIGAMLVAPLMTPILALAASLMYAQMKRFAGSLTLVIAGTISAVATGWLVATIGSGRLAGSELSAELLARTAPSLLDLGIAVAAGLAGGYVLTHKGSGSSLPGVAISVALVPPLATVGIALQLHAMQEALGALLLYTTNMVAIVLSASIVMFVSGFVPDYLHQGAKGKLGIRLLPWALALIAVAVPLAAHTQSVIRDEVFTRQVATAVAAWDARATIVDMTIDRSGDRAAIDMTVVTSGEPEPAWKLASAITTDYTVEVDLDLKYQQEATDASSTG